MTRLLVVSLNYAPEPTGIGPYTAGVAEHLAGCGYQVTVLTGVPHYPAWRKARAHAGLRSGRERVNGVDVRRFPHYVPARQSAARRGMYELSSLSMALGLRDVPRPDAVLGITPSVSGGVVARLAGARFGAPHGIVFQDLVGRSGQSGVSGAAFAAPAARLAERWCVRGAAAVGIVADGFRPYVESLGIDPGRVRRLRNWSRLGAATIARDEVRERLGWPADAFVCLHAGNMGQKQALENVLETASLAARTGAHNLLFVLCGDGSQRRRLEQIAQARSLANTRFLALQPAESVPSVLAAADVLLVNQRPSLHDMSLPSKLAAYWAAGRAVVAAAAADSETAREVGASGGGIVVTPGSASALLAAIIRLHRDPELRRQHAERGLAWAREVLSAAAALRGYEQFVAAILAGAGRARVHHAGRIDARGAISGGAERERGAA